MLQIFFGIEQRYLDITEVVCRVCQREGDSIIIPKTEELRCSLFGDPCWGHLKHILVLEHTAPIRAQKYDHNTQFSVKIANLDKFPYVGNPHQKLARLHASLKFEGGTLMDEYPEQVMAVSFIDPDEVVLELGSNRGRNTLIIASLLKDSKNFVTLETDPASVEYLIKNRDINNFQFTAINAALAKRNLYQQRERWNTIVADVPPGDDWFKVATITPDDLGIKPNVLVVDCEGALYQILQDFPDLLTNVNKVLVENDYWNAEHKFWVDREFVKNGLKLVYNDYSPAAARISFPCCTMFYQVWKREKLN